MTAITVAHPTTGEPLPAVIHTPQAARLIGICVETCRRRCEEGALPVLPRHGNEPWRIPTAALLRQLGFEPAPSAPSPSSARVADGLVSAGGGAAGAPGTGGSSPAAPVQRGCVSDNTSAAAGTHLPDGDVGPGGGEIDERGVA